MRRWHIIRYFPSKLPSSRPKDEIPAERRLLQQSLSPCHSPCRTVIFDHGVPTSGNCDMFVQSFKIRKYVIYEAERSSFTHVVHLFAAQNHLQSRFDAD